jgi:predicted DNA binding CopG/RHH family protein
MKKQLNKPKFKNEAQEAEWWANLDITEYFEPGDFKRVSFPNLKPTTRPISIRLPEWLITQLKERANELVIPYQTLIKQFIKKGLQRRDL